MAIISGVTINWGVSPRIITIPQSYGVTVSVEDLLDTLQDIEDSEAGIAFLRLHDASGHETLSSTEQVALTIKLINAKLEFEDRASSTVCSVTGGNLVAVDVNGNAIDAIQFSDNVVVMLKSSSSGTLIGAGEMQTDLAYIKQIEQGRWKIVSNQMIFYDADGTTPLRTFNLKDKQGQAAETNIFERIPV